jgi:transcriptional antiterminator NusG
VQDEELNISNDSKTTDDSQSISDAPVAEEPTMADAEQEVAEENLDSEESATEGDEVASQVPGEEIQPETVEAAEEIAEEAEMEAEPSFAPVVDATQTSSKWPGKWYVLHTYSGYEDAVADGLKQRIESLDMQDKIFDVMVPKENQIEIKAGKRKIVEKKMFPGYVLVNMNVTHDSWFVVRNTPNVTGFIGTDTDPVPVEESEIKAILKRMSIEEPKYNIDLSVGDLVHIKDGPFKNYDGAVSEVDEERGKIKVLVSIFGRETPVELDFLQVAKV